MSKRSKGRKPGGGDIATNRQARFRYELLEKWEAGIALQGSEVKSAARRQGEPQGRVRARARRRGVAAQHAHRALRARPRARATTPSGRASC